MLKHRGMIVFQHEEAGILRHNAAHTQLIPCAVLSEHVGGVASTLLLSTMPLSHHCLCEI